MKKVLGLLLGVIMMIQLAPIGSAEMALPLCGSWSDVPDTYIDQLTEVCDYGIIMGKNQFDFGFDDHLSRTEIAVIANRLAMGSDYYDNVGSGNDYEYRMINQRYTDIPSLTNSNGWMMKAIYFAFENRIMEGDGGEDAHPTTFRPNDSVKMAEMFKVYYESMVSAEIQRDALYFSPNYNKSPWFEDLLIIFDSEGVIDRYDNGVDNRHYWMTAGNGGPSIHRSDKSEARRGDAAFAVWQMIDKGLIDRDKLEEHVNTPYIAWKGIQISSSGFSVSIPDSWSHNPSQYGLNGTVGEISGDGIEINYQLSVEAPKAPDPDRVWMCLDCSEVYETIDGFHAVIITMGETMTLYIDDANLYMNAEGVSSSERDLILTIFKKVRF